MSTSNFKGFIFNENTGELLKYPNCINWFDLQEVYTILINTGEYIKASRIEQLSRTFYPEIKCSLFKK